MNVIDLRSDTVTLPTDEMRKAIANATLGDDVSGEDPTVNKLEKKAADLTGKEAALLVSSGTQGNLIGILANCQRGDEIIVGENAHIFWNESATFNVFDNDKEVNVFTDYTCKTIEQAKQSGEEWLDEQLQEEKLDADI